MAIDYRISKVSISSFRGIDEIEICFSQGKPTVLIGANNAGKSTVLEAIALALNGGGSHQWSFSERDFFCAPGQERHKKFLIQLHFSAATEMGHPAVQGVGKPTLIYGAQAKGVLQKNGIVKVTRTLFGADGETITYATRTAISKNEKDKWAEHGVGYRKVNARIQDISDNAPEVWFFTPQNIEASLYVWKTGPIAKLAKLLADRFLNDQWVMELDNGDKRAMPDTLKNAYAFFQKTVEAFPFWKDDMKPKLEKTFQRYVGSQAKIDLRPDVQTIEDWLAQQLAIDLATDPDSLTTPLKDMGDGWQSVIRLAALEALTMYPDLIRDRVVLLLEEPETHLHPHLRRRMRKVLNELSKRGWTVVYTSHSAEMISFDEDITISRLVRSAGLVENCTVTSDQVSDIAKLQAKMDQNGAHEFLFSTAVVFCEGPDDRVASQVALERLDAECDARSVSITQCGAVTSVPAFVDIARRLGIRWCALTDEDMQEDGTIKPNTKKSRDDIDSHKSDKDEQVTWKNDLEFCLDISQGKARPDKSIPKISQEDWKTAYPKFYDAISKIANWIDPSIET